MAKIKVTQKTFDEVFESIKEEVLLNKFDKNKEKKILKLISDNLRYDQTRMIYLLFTKLAKIDKKVDVSIELSEIYSFAIIYCLARKLHLNVKETNALYDEVDREARGILEGTMKAKEEVRYLSKILSLKDKKEGSGK